MLHPWVNEDDNFKKNKATIESVLKLLEICNTTMSKSHFQKVNCKRFT